MVNDKAPARSRLVVILVVLSALVGAGTIALLYTFLVEYGPTTGSRVDGATRGLVLAAIPLLVIGVLAAFALRAGRHSAGLRRIAVASVLLSVCGVLVAGAQAAVVKYDRLPKVPHCDAADGSGAVPDAMAALAHPAPFGGSWSSTQACGADLLNVTFAEAAAHYRDRLPAAGWSITHDDGNEVAARRDSLVFVLTHTCGPVVVEMKVADATDIGQRC